MGFIEQAAAIVGSAQVLTGSDMARYVDDPTGAYHSAPLCVVRPGSTQEVSDLMALAYGMDQVVVPVSGNTGVSGGTFNEGAVMLSVERMNAVREVNASARTATVEAGVILDRLRDAADDAGLVFPSYSARAVPRWSAASCRPMRADRTSCATATRGRNASGSRWCLPTGGSWT